jgi:hypothetical protein
MKYIWILLVFPFLSASECGKKKTGEENAVVNDSIPPCVRKIIDDATKDIPPTTPLQIDEYSYQGKKGYLVTAACCDHYNVFYDENCKMICAPSGGFTGKGDEKCSDFNATAKHIKLIWKKTEK